MNTVYKNYDLSKLGNTQPYAKTYQRKVLNSKANTLLTLYYQKIINAPNYRDTYLRKKEEDPIIPQEDEIQSFEKKIIPFKPVKRDFKKLKISK